MAETVLRVDNLSKKFKIKRTSLANQGHNRINDQFYAIRNLSFDIKEGEICGLIGRNGAGKTTLLELLSGITKPSEGEITIYGKAASVIDIGTGMHRDLTGLENIFLAGEILGMKRQEITDRLDEIIAFSELENFLDLPVKHYSSGMYMRLAFSVLTHLSADILLIDEIIGVGDLAFSEKTTAKIIEICRQGKSAIIATHSLTLIKACCNTALYLRNGVMATKGQVDQVEEMYLDDIMENKSLISTSNVELSKPFKPNLEFCPDQAHQGEEKEINLEYASVKAIPSGSEVFSIRDELKFELLINLKTNRPCIISLHINYHYNQPAICLIPELIKTTEVSPGNVRLSTVLPSNFLNQGLYTVSVFFVGMDDNLINSYENVLIFKVHLDDRIKTDFGYSGKFSGPVFRGGNWQIEKE